MSEITFVPHPKQREVLTCKNRFVAAVAGKRGGKSVCGAVWLIDEIQRLRDLGKHGHFLVAAPTNKILEQATLPTFREYFNRLGWGAGKNGGWRESKSCFELKWKTPGGEPCYIYVRSTEEVEHLEGMTILAAWLDEAGQMKDGTFDNVQARLSFDRGRAIITTTPYAPNWFWRDIMNRACEINGVAQENEDTDPSVSMFQWTTLDNPHFSEEEFARLKKSMSPDKFARDYEGQARSMEGLVYDLTEDAIVKPFQLDPTWRRFAGMDFGQSDPTVVLCIAEKPEQQATEANGMSHLPSIYYVYREFYKRGALLAQSAEFLQAEQLEYVLYDPSAAQQAAEIQRGLGIRRMLAADNRHEVGIERLKGLINQGRLRIFRGRCDNTIREILHYHYKAPNFDRPQADDPVGVDDHCMDALRYAFSRENVNGLYRGTQQRHATRRAIGRTPWWGKDASRAATVDRWTAYPI
jgi:PBSX family phage terminase large subunit